MKNVLQKLLISTLLISSMALAAEASKSSSKIPGSESGGGGEPLVPLEFGFHPKKADIKMAFEDIRGRAIAIFRNMDNSYGYSTIEKKSLAGQELRIKMLMNPSKVIHLIKNAKIEIKETGGCEYKNKEHMSENLLASASAKNSNTVCFSLDYLEKNLSKIQLRKAATLEKILADLYIHEIAHLFGADEFSVSGLHESLNNVNNDEDFYGSHIQNDDIDTFVEENRKLISIITNMLSSKHDSFNQDYLVDFCSTVHAQYYTNILDSTLEQQMYLDRIHLRSTNLAAYICKYKTIDFETYKKNIESSYFPNSEVSITEKQIFQTDLKIESNGEFNTFGLGVPGNIDSLIAIYRVNNLSDKIVYRNLKNQSPKAIHNELIDLRKDLMKLNQSFLDMKI